MAICGACKSEIHDEATICPHCRTERDPNMETFVVFLIAGFSAAIVGLVALGGYLISLSVSIFGFAKKKIEEHNSGEKKEESFFKSTSSKILDKVDDFSGKARKKINKSKDKKEE